MFFYKLYNKYLISKFEYEALEQCTEKEVAQTEDVIFYLYKLNPLKSRRSFSVSDPSLLFLEKEGINLLCKDNGNYDNIPNWLISKIEDRKVVAINTEYSTWSELLSYSYPEKWNINILALGDVGGMLLTGLRLAGGDCINKIGIYDRSENKVKRWEYEMNQILAPFSEQNFPEVYGITKERLFDCDMFVFCASAGVPPVGDEKNDVRMVQFEGNSRIIKQYAKMARDQNFKGIFAVVSDPVDLLCKVVFLESNKNETGNIDFKGLASEQIRGYGLGVMNARASYYAGKNPKTAHYLREGRVFGPHGNDLVVADSIENYNEEISQFLTAKTIDANIEIRKIGFKPYIAPALSSGALSIIATISKKWHYSSTFMGGVFMGAKNKLNKSGIELERLSIPEPLMKRLNYTYERLGSII